MKSKKLTAVFLAVVMLFTCMIPAYASENAAAEENTPTISLIEKIKDIIHGIIEKIFSLFNIECPFCEANNLVPSNINETVAKYNEGINSVKNYKDRIRIIKSEKVSCSIGDYPDVAATIIEEVLKNLTGTTLDNSIYNDGKSSDGKSITDILEPCGREASLISTGVASAESTVLEDGGSKNRITLKKEVAVFNGTSMVNDAVYNAAVITALNLGVLDLGPIKVESAEITYEGTVLEAEYDSQGRLVELSIEVPVSIQSCSKVGLINVTGTVLAKIDTEYRFSY